MPSKPAAKKDKTGEAGKLYIVATPIGNLADISLRALETLRSADLIAAEDTRHTRKLLSAYDIHKPLLSYHANSARQRGAELLEKIASGQNVALVTDAGTPGISDPGTLLVQAAIERGIEPTVIPGPAALICALIVSGLPPHPFAFLGFPPPSGAGRRRFFAELSAAGMTTVVYESARRLAKTLQDVLDTCGDRRVAVARELTKLHEEVFRGTVSEAREHFAGGTRGELTLVIEQGRAEAGRQAEPPGWEEELRSLLEQGVSSKEAASAVSSRFGLPRRRVYQAALGMRRR